jgi:putative ABC transport system permease protein
MLQDYTLGLRMLRKYPGLTIAGGLALAVAIAVGAGWYDLWGRLLAPIIPLPEGDRVVLIETQNALTNETEPRVARDFLEWRHALRTIEDLGAYRAETRNLIPTGSAPQPIHTAAMTAAAFRTARVTPLLGRGLLDSDEAPGAPEIVVLGYDLWQREWEGRQDVIGSDVTLGDTKVTVVGVMPAGFRYPVNHDAWTPLRLRASTGPLEGGPISVIGRLAPGVTREQADGELRVVAEQAAAARPATHAHLRPRAIRPGELPLSRAASLALTNLPGLLMLLIACLTVGTLMYARTAMREGEVALRSALGASRARIVGQLFVEALVLVSIAAAAGLIAADRALRWGIEAATGNRAPFWMTGGLRLSTILYASGLAIAGAAMVSLLPALRVTRARVQPHLANLGSGGATLRFGRVWTTMMIAQVALTAIGIPAAMEAAGQAMRTVSIRARFASREYLAARLDVDRPSETETTQAFEERRTRALAALEHRVAQEPGVIAIAFAEYAPGSAPKGIGVEVALSPSAGAEWDRTFATTAVGRGFFEAFARPIVAGRGFHGGDHAPGARTLIVNEAFVREFQRVTGHASPIGARMRDRAPSTQSRAVTEFEIVGVVRDFGLDPVDGRDEAPYVFHAASPRTMSPLVMNVRVRGNPAALAARFANIAAGVEAGLYVQEARALDEWIRQRDRGLILTVGAQVGVTALVLFLSAMGIFSLTSVSVSRRTREIGVRMALGADPRRVLTGVLSRAMVLTGSGVAAGGALLLWVVTLAGPIGRPAEDIALFAGWLALTAVVMIAACLLACIEPARRALRINPIDALRHA